MSVSYTTLHKNNNTGETLSASESDVIITTATSQVSESCKHIRTRQIKIKQIIVTYGVPFLFSTLDSCTYIFGAFRSKQHNSYFIRKLKTVLIFYLSGRTGSRMTKGISSKYTRLNIFFKVCYVISVPDIIICVIMTTSFLRYLEWLLSRWHCITFCKSPSRDISSGDKKPGISVTRSIIAEQQISCPKLLFAITALLQYSVLMLFLIITVIIKRQFIPIQAVEAFRIARVWGSHIFRHSIHRWRQVCQPYALAAFYPPGRFLVLISVRGRVDPRAIMRLEGLGQLKKFHLIRLVA
jgi:hypothetical protein